MSLKPKRRTPPSTSPKLEQVVADAIRNGESPVVALADYRKVHPRETDYRDVVTLLAADRVKRAIAETHIVIRPNDMRKYILERLVLEAEEASEGGARLRALEMLGNLPGIDAWAASKAKDAAPEVAAGELAEALTALEDRLNNDDVQEVENVDSPGLVDLAPDAVQSEPNGDGDPWEEPRSSGVSSDPFEGSDDDPDPGVDGPGDPFLDHDDDQVEAGPEGEEPGIVDADTDPWD